MQTYFNWLRDNQGNVVAGGQVAVYDANTSNLSAIYVPTNDGNATVPKPNPFTSDPNGYFEFSCPNGDYQLVFSGGNLATTIVRNVNIWDGGSGPGGPMTNPMSNIGEFIHGGVGGTPTAGAANTTTTPKYLREVGNGTVASPPAFAQIPASEVANTPAGTIGSTNVQAALNELDAEKVASADLSNTSNVPLGDALVGVKQPYGSAVATTQHEFNSRYVSVKDFGAVGDGVTNDAVAIQNALNNSKYVFFPSGTYYLGASGTGVSFLQPPSGVNGMRLEMGANVTFVCNTTANVINNFFYIYNCSDLYVGPAKFIDNGFDITQTWHGANCFYLDGASGVEWGNLTFESIRGDNVLSLLYVTGAFANGRIRGIHLGQGFLSNGYYGVVCANNGDGLKIDNLVTYNCYRSYYVYGVQGHEVNIFARAQRSTSGAVNIARAVGGFSTKAIKVRYVSRDNTNSITHVLINHIDLLGGTISGIDIEVNIESSANYYPVRFVNYTGAGGSETSAASSNVVTEIKLRGSCDAQSLGVSAVASYASRGPLDFWTFQFMYFDSTIPPLFRLGDTFVNQAVTWTASTTNPVIGNGVLSCDYTISGNICTATIKMIAGSTTTFGSGLWTFTLPFTAKSIAIGSVHALQTGVAFFNGVAKMTAGTNLVQCFGNNVGNGFSSSVPFAWANGNELYITVTFPIQ